MDSVLYFRPDGSIESLGECQLGERTARRRASHIEPCRPALRLAFRILRACCSDNSRIADWTRTWPCHWRVNMRPVGGPVFPYRFGNRSLAIAFEHNWLLENYQ